MLHFKKSVFGVFIMKFGFTTTSFRQIKSLEKIVDIAVLAGADCIEWGGDVHVKNVADAKKAKELCKKHGIGISSYGSYYRAGSKKQNEWRKICEIASTLGADSVRVWLGTKDSEKTDEKAYMAITEDVKFMCSVAAEYSLLVCPECHDNTYNNNTDAYLKINSDVSCKNFRTYFQSRYKKLNYDLDRIRRTMPYIENIHISFSELTREQFPKHNPDYMDELLKVIIQSGFDGTFLIEYTYLFSRAGIPSSMKKDLEKLKEKVDKLK